MEKTLKTLFDYQRFEGNPSLARLIRETEERCGRELSDEDLDMVNAAGEIIPGENNGQSKEQNVWQSGGKRPG